MKLDAGLLAVEYLGKISVFLAIGFGLCFLAFIGFNTYFKFQDKDKKIEVQTKNSNFPNDE